MVVIAFNMTIIYFTNVTIQLIDDIMFETSGSNTSYCGLFTMTWFNNVTRVLLRLERTMNLLCH